MRKHILWAAIGCLLFISCQKDEVAHSKPAEKINFQSPEVGQASRYLLLRGDDYKNNANSSFSYLPDTLAIEIVEKHRDTLLLKEYLTPGSVSLNGQNNVAFADSTIYYDLLLESDMLYLRNRHFRMTSRLFFLPSPPEGLSLRAYDNLEVAFQGWKTELPYATNLQTAFAENFELLGVMYDHLNILIDNRAMKNKSQGCTHVYSRKHGLVRSSQYSWYTGKGYGWDLLP
jgi:hypothetical protein